MEKFKPRRRRKINEFSVEIKLIIAKKVGVESTGFIEGKSEKRKGFLLLR